MPPYPPWDPSLLLQATVPPSQPFRPDLKAFPISLQKAKCQRVETCPNPPGIQVRPPFRPGLTLCPPPKEISSRPSLVIGNARFYQADYKPHDAAGLSCN